MTVQLIPDKTVPFPDNLEPEEAPTLIENMQIAANTAQLIAGVGGETEEDPEAQEKADKVFKEFSAIAEQQYKEAMNPTPKRGPGRPRKPSTELSRNPDELKSTSVAQRIGVMLKEYDNEFVADAAQLRLVVTNKLLDLATCGDPKIEIKATEMLGKISDVGLFSDKTEISVTYKNVSDIDQAIKDKVRKMLLVHGGEVTTLDIDLDKEFGEPLLIEEEPHPIEEEPHGENPNV